MEHQRRILYDNQVLFQPTYDFCRIGYCCHQPPFTFSGIIIKHESAYPCYLFSFMGLCLQWWYQIQPWYRNEHENLLFGCSPNQYRFTTWIDQRSTSKVYGKFHHLTYSKQLEREHPGVNLKRYIDIERQKYMIYKNWKAPDTVLKSHHT